MGEPRVSKCVVLPLGDDGESYVAFGWVSKREFRLQVAKYNGEPPPLREIEHAWCIEDDGPEYGDEGPYYRYSKDETPRAVKATWWML